MILEVKNLIKRYGDTLAVDNISFSIKEGEIFGLLGPNGAGKTTAIDTVIGIRDADKGEINIFGKDMKKHASEIKKYIGIVPQDIAIYPDLTAYENVEFFGRLYDLKGSLLKARVEEVLEFTGLLDQKKQFVRNFSGGMKRRLNIACALVHRPKLIIMDEPTVGIDPQSRNHIIESVKKMRNEGSTIIYTSHYMEEVEQLCSYIAIMDHGKIIARGSKEELKDFVTVEEKTVITLDGINYTLVDRIKTMDNVVDCSVEGNVITVISKKGTNNLNNIIQCIIDSGNQIVSLISEKPDLETVFLTLTGRTLRDEVTTA
ncbi:ABC-2 type transport system ATP-binding protein [Lutispora thermophila DSM 19022]|uniref:ABC-2 type transport system ATP-binding protein n=2 Tax=Lutispora TaxID=667112 RepID=A0A1M6E390_9FIRM|nr:ABC transporter ATP-binding protein [Lutispora thermophila]SHI79865.1 ABC-2 type transport system ATP-binding protein [Lutispora thermophila DSM 19022]